MSTELKINVYSDPSPKYKATDDVYVRLALHGSKWVTYHKGKITKIEYNQRPPDRGGDLWQVSVILDLESTRISDYSAPTLVHVSHEEFLSLIKNMQDGEDRLRQKFADIEEGYKRAIKAMAEKK